MKILYLTDQTYLHGGVEKVLSQKANFLAEVYGDEVIIVTYNQQRRKPVYNFSKKIKMFDLEINYEISKSYFDSTNLKKIPNHRRALLRILRHLNPDVIVSCSFGPDFYFIPFLANIPVVKEFHSSRYFNAIERVSGVKWILRKVTGFVEAKYSALVVLNPDEVSFYKSSHTVVIPNPAELSKPTFPLAKKQIIAAGRISPVKNLGHLIDAFGKLSADFPQWQLHFWGEDYVETQADLQRKIDNLGLQKQIKFMGVSDDLKMRMKDYSIYAMTSETECFPMVLLESLSAGLPVLTYDSPTGPRYIVNDRDDGFIVPYRNLDIFTQKLRLLMSDENLRREMGSKGRINVQRYSIDKIMAQWQKLFEQVTRK